MKKFLYLVALCLSAGQAYSQAVSLYNIRGIVVDDITKAPLENALIHVLNYESQAATSNENGEFTIQGLPVGRHVLEVSYLGYEIYSRSIDIISGKELVLQINLAESINQLDEVVVSGNMDKSRTVNSLSYASTRTFSVEESNRFAGAVDDPGRMVQSFAGVIPTNDGNNTISIRGNHPSALLYRVEGIDVPNPNHFGDGVSAGGGVSVLSSQILTNSDFSTGAFSAEYGNAVGGVFDFKLRKGNNKKREYTIKAGFLGLEAAVEGPFSKKYNGSYLINYRYSTLSLISKLGVDLAGVLNYSDLSYNINLPFKKKANISLFGINGWSSQNIDEDLEDNDEIPGASYHRFVGEFLSDMSVNGIKYTTSIKKNGFFSVIAAYGTSLSGYNEHVETIFPSHEEFSKYDIENKNDKVSLALSFTQKLTPKITLRSGTYFDRIGFNVNFNQFVDKDHFINLINNNDQANFARAFSQMQINMNSRWQANAGLHYSNFLMNNKQSLEFRGNVQYKINGRSDISLAYGGHSQLQPLIIYFIKSGDGNFVNKDLDFTKAHHFVLTHNWNFNSNSRLKTELYYQSLSNIPVGINENKNYSMANQLFLLPDFQLVSDGKGRNMGIEFTLERFLKNNWYYLITGSLFDSKYKNPTTDWINTRYNVGYTSVVSFGKEWSVGKLKRNTLGFNIKNALVGGQYDTPIDREASQAAKTEIRDETNPFSVRLGKFYKLDLGIKLKVNKKHRTSTFSLDLMNATNHQNIGGVSYDIYNDKMKEWTMMPFVPVFSYKLEF